MHDLNFGPYRPILCLHCGKDRMEHHAKTHGCPQGTRHRVFGWPWFHPTQRFEPRPKRRPPVPDDRRMR